MKTEMHLPRPEVFSYGIRDERDYIKTMREYLRDSKNSPFMTDSLECDTLIADMMIGSSERSVMIYTRELLRGCFSFALSGIPDGVKVRILHSEEFKDNEKWWQQMFPKKDIIASHVGFPLVYDDTVVNHFFTCDGVALHYKVKEGIAISNFNMPNVCRGLNTAFENAWRKVGGMDSPIPQPAVSPLDIARI